MPIDKDIFFLQSGKTPWEPYVPVENYEIGEVKYLRRPGQGDSRIANAGTWRGPREALQNVKSTYEQAETIYIIDGRVKIETDDGQVLELGTGDAMSFDKGSTVTWTILSDTFHEFFIFN